MMDNIAQRPGDRIDKVRFIPVAASATGVGVSCLVLGGWGFNLSALRSVIPGQPQMVPNTAITFVLASLSLGMLWSEKKSQSAYRLTWVCAATVVLIGFLILVEYLSGASPGFDRLLFREKLPALATSFPGRPSPHTALNFLIIGVTLLLMRTQKVR